MIDRFKEHIRNRMPEILEEPLVIGVSGGVDSMVLLYLLKSLNPLLSVAHCNYHLRGDESQ